MHGGLWGSLRPGCGRAGSPTSEIPLTTPYYTWILATAPRSLGRGIPTPLYRCCAIQGISGVGVPLCLSFRVLLLFVVVLGFFCHNSLNPLWLWCFVHLAFWRSSCTAAPVQTFLWPSRVSLRDSAIRCT